ncbi:SRPBCC family protein [Halomarina litorea]|uniref:SRPBCC family protein n=1 Tax=Halomarina litorea TaxID=2961595 RepID=UPI0020C5033C|nr:SRPBCC family protein [Halomarina sp. BCD28]
MPTIRLVTHVDAPTERVFDLARSVDLQYETLRLDARPVAGLTGGLGAPGEKTVWRASVFGKRVDLTTKVTAYSRPHHFRRTLVRGPFDRLIHDYFFVFEDQDDPEDGTVMREVFTYESPYGPLGRVVDSILRERLEGMLAARADRIREVAESEDGEWRRYLSD